MVRLLWLFGELYRREGVTQGDPLSMFLYAVGTLPLISSLKRPSLWTQMWYADNASACGRLVHIRQWFNLLLQRGPSFGYYPNPRKCSLVVDSESRSSAEQIFGPLGVRIVCDQRFLGGFLGNTEARNSYVLERVHQWVLDIKNLSQVAIFQLQTVYSPLYKSLQHKWIYLQ